MGWIRNALFGKDDGPPGDDDPTKQPEDDGKPPPPKPGVDKPPVSPQAQEMPAPGPTDNSVHHCPFCGSGNVVGGSDGTVSCGFCFAGETEYLTWDGIRTFKETVGTTQLVLTSTAHNASPTRHTGGRWVEAEIQCFGDQPLMKVTLQRYRSTKVIYATPEHRWLVTPSTVKGFNTGKTEVVLTEDLLAGQRLAPLFSRSRVSVKPTKPSPFGIAHGFVFGDGNRERMSSGTSVTLWGEKDAALAPYFHDATWGTQISKTGVIGKRVRGLPNFFKDRPSQAESLGYLYGWLAGYFAADGTVMLGGTPVLTCADPEELEFVRTLCHQLGIGTLGIRAYDRLGYGTEPTKLYSLTFVSNTLTPEFFVIPEHRRRFEARKAQDSNNIAWRVASVEATDRVEHVYCAVVPEHHNFTLTDNINVMNCEKTFKVYAEPSHPYMPQTINGEPYQPPGEDPITGEPIPAAGAPTPAPGTSPAPTPVPSGLEKFRVDSGAPGAPGAVSPGSLEQYRTAAGKLLNRDQFIRHLALNHADNRDEIISLIKASNIRTAKLKDK